MTQYRYGVPSAEDMLGAALQNTGSKEVPKELMDAFDLSEWMEVCGREYPDCYAAGLRWKASEFAVTKMRRVLARIPRVRPEDYDILFNTEGSDFADGWMPTWDVVKWMPTPKVAGFWPGIGPMMTVGAYPYPVYAIPAPLRSADSLGEIDFNIMRANSTVLRPPQDLDAELFENNMAYEQTKKQYRQDEDLDFAEYYRDLYKREAEELGI